MQFLEFQNLLGKNIDKANVIGNNPKPTPNIYMYYILTELDNYFYGKPYNHVVLNTDQQYNIKDITIYISELINKSFYNAFIKHYGKPNSIQIVDTIKSISKSKGGLFNRISEKRFITMKEGSFEDNPLYIQWNMKNFQIKIIFRRNTNRSEITFRIPKNNF